MTYPGRVKAAADVDLAFRVAGPIIRIPVQVGSFVRKGEVIAEIDPRDYELQYKATEAEYKQIKSEAERVIELYNRKSVPEKITIKRCMVCSKSPLNIMRIKML